MNFEEASRHFAVPSGDAFDVPPEQAIAFFRGKGLLPSFAWQDVLEHEHQIAFTVAKMLDLDLLADVRESLDAALADGVPYETWAKEITPKLQARGWWGKQAMPDPLTGETVTAQLGSPSRLQTIFRTNMQSAYAEGQWDQIEATADEADLLLYDAVDDGRTRPAHAAWDNLVLPVKARFWRSHTPPCGWNCRCGVIQLSREEAEEMGFAVSTEPRTQTREWQNPRTGDTQRVPVGVDPGFGGAASQRLDRLEALAAEKLEALPPDMAAAATRKAA